MTATETVPPQRKRYKRRLRNYLLDVGLQLRYTATIVLVAAFLTAGLGYKMYDATCETSRVIVTQNQLDPMTARELTAQFSGNDRVVLWGIVGFGFVLVLSIAAAGILITHKVAGPIFKIASICTRVRDGKLSPAPPHLRKGDELQDFYSTFREMHEAVRGRVEDDIRVIGDAIAAVETAEAPKGQEPVLQGALEQLRALRRRKQESIES